MSKADVTIGNVASLRSLKSVLNNGPKGSKNLVNALNSGAISQADFLNKGQKLHTDVLSSQAEVAGLLLEVNAMIKKLEKEESNSEKPNAIEASSEEASSEKASSEEANSKESKENSLLEELKVLADHLNAIATANIADSIAVDKLATPSEKDIADARKEYEKAKTEVESLSKAPVGEKAEAKTEREDNLKGAKQALQTAKEAYAKKSNEAAIKFLKEQAAADINDLDKAAPEATKKGIETKRDEAIKAINDRFKPAADVSKHYKAAKESLEKLLKMKEVTPESGFKAFFQRIAEAIIRVYRSVIRFFTVKDIYSEAANAETDIEKVAIFRGMNLADQNKAFSTGEMSAVEAAEKLATAEKHVYSSKLGRQATRVAGKVADVLKAPFVATKNAVKFATGPLSTYNQPVSSEEVKMLNPAHVLSVESMFNNPAVVMSNSAEAAEQSRNLEAGTLG